MMLLYPPDTDKETVGGMPPMTGGGRSQSAAVRRSFAVVVAVLLAGCGSDDGARDGLEGGSPASRQQATIGAIDDVIAVGGELKELEGVWFRACMADSGFPQPTEVEEMTVGTVPPGRHSAIRADPLEMGPYTEEQAREFGMAGTAEAAFAEPRPGVLINNDPSFDRAAAECDAEFTKTAGTETKKLLSRLTDLTNTIRKRRLAVTEQPITDLLAQRLGCVRDKGNYPGLDPGVFLGAGSFSESLASLDIAVGETVRDEPKIPHVNAGEVKVFPPPKLPEYHPTEDEIKFALTYVECGERVSFVKKLEEINNAALSEIFPDYEAELMAIGESLRDAVKRVGDK